VLLGRSWSKTLFEGYRPVPVESPVESPVDALLLEQPAVVAVVQVQQVQVAVQAGQ
jgi:phosphatidylserine decarboxylase